MNYLLVIMNLWMMDNQIPWMEILEYVDLDVIMVEVLLEDKATSKMVDVDQEEDVLQIMITAGKE